MTATGPGKRFSWGFRTGFLGILALVLWTEVAMTALRAALAADGADRWPWLLAFVGLLLPPLFLVAYRWTLVRGFFRSIKVGTLNLALIGLASILGVLFHQEDANRPIPPPVEGKTVFETGRYDHYLDFRHAQAYFVYHLLHGRGYHLLPGVDPECRVDEGAIAGQMDNLARWTPILGTRYGEDYALGLKVNTEKGLRVRQENAEVDALEKAWDNLWWTTFVVADDLDLLRVYKSDWFAALWAILFLGVVTSAVHKGLRGMLRFRAWGFTLSHVGVMLIVVGAFWGRLAEERGMVHLTVGNAKGGFQLYDGRLVAFQRPPSLLGIVPEGEPFLVRLDAFRADYHDVLEAIYMKDGPDGRLETEFPVAPPKERVYQGKTVELDRGPLPDGGTGPYMRLEVLEYVPQARVRPAVLPAGEATEEAAAAVELVLRSDQTGEEMECCDDPTDKRHADGSCQERTLILREGEAEAVHDPESGLRLRLRLASGLEDARQLLAEGFRERYGVLRLAGDDAASGWQADVLPGASWKVQAGGVEYTVRVLEATPNLRLRKGPGGRWQNSNRELPVSGQEARNPALLLYVEGPGGQSEERWVMSSHFHSGGRTFPELAFTFEWDDWAAPATAHWEFFFLDDGRLAVAPAGAPGELRALAPDEAVELVAGWRATPGTVLRRAIEGEIIEPVAGSDFFDGTPGAVRLRAASPDGSEEFVLSAAGQGAWHLLHYPGPAGAQRTLLVRFREDRDDMPLEWRSRLSVLRPAGEDGGGVLTAATGEVRVNDYFTFDGFRFFQTNADPRRPDYSGIGVVYDPGIELVLLGMWMIMAGTVVAFIIKPLVLRRTT